MILYVYKIQKIYKNKKQKHKEPGYLLHPKWAFYPQLCIYRFGVLRGYKVQWLTFLCVCESKVSTATTGSCDYSSKAEDKVVPPQKPAVRTHHPEDCWGSMWMLIYPTHSAKKNLCSVNKNCGLRGEMAPSFIQHNMK